MIYGHRLFFVNLRHISLMLMIRRQTLEMWNYNWFSVKIYLTLIHFRFVFCFYLIMFFRNAFLRCGCGSSSFVSGFILLFYVHVFKILFIHFFFFKNLRNQLLFLLRLLFLIQITYHSLEWYSLLAYFFIIFWNTLFLIFILHFLFFLLFRFRN